jgi:group I intron endonuclease
MTGIYKITNLINNKVYIGQSINIEGRWKEGFNLNSVRHYNMHLLNAVKKYGEQNFKKEVILETFDLSYWEKFFIFWYRSSDPNYGYNKTNGGESGPNFFTEEVKQKIREKALQRPPVSEETRLKISLKTKGKNNPMYGCKGMLNPNFGRKRNDDERSRISKATKKRWDNMSDEERSEICLKMSENHADLSGKNHPLYGVGHTLESRQKMSNSKKELYKEHPEIRKKLSESHKGKQTGGQNPNSKKVKCVETNEVFGCIKDAQEAYNTRSISSVLHGHQKTAGGYHWEFA